MQAEEQDEILSEKRHLKICPCHKRPMQGTMKDGLVTHLARLGRSEGRGSTPGCRLLSQGKPVPHQTLCSVHHKTFAFAPPQRIWNAKLMCSGHADWG